jgi:hypothetical protein
MAQKILLRRGPVGNLKAANVTKGELLLATGSIGDLSGPFVTMAGISGTGAASALGKIYTGATAPSITTLAHGTTLDGLPFYSTNDQALYVLGADGNTKLDLSGNLEGTHIADIKASGSFSGSFEGNGAGLTNIPASNIILAEVTDGNGIADFTYNGQNAVTISAEISGSTLTLGSAGLAVNASGITTVEIADGVVTNVKLANSSIYLAGGNGLTGDGSTALGASGSLAVGAGLGIAVTADAVNVDTGSAHFTNGVRGKISATDTTGASGIDLTYNAATGVLNGSLVNSSVTLGTTTIDLGDTEGTLDGLNLTDVQATGSFTGSFKGDGSALTNLNLGSLTAPGNDTELLYNNGGALAATSNLKVVGDNLEVTGDISGSSLLLTGDAKIDGNIVLGGNITIGDASSDNISLGGEFTSNLIPSTDSTYDLGTNTKRWSDIYVDNISGSTAHFSAQVILGNTVQAANIGTGTDNSVVILDSNGFLKTDEIDSRVWGATLVGTTGTPVDNQLAVFTAADTVEGVAGLTFDGSTLAVAGTITGSDVFIDGWNSISASLAAISTGAFALTLDDVTDNGATTTNSIQVGGLTVTGDLLVQGTTTTVDSTTIKLGDNIIELNGSGAANGGLLVKDVTNPNLVSGSLLWDSTADYWKGGALGSEKEFARFDATPTLNKVAVIGANGLLVDSTITDNGSAVSTTSTFSATTITASTGFVATGLTGVIDTSSRVIFRDGSNRLGALGTTDSAVEVSTVMGYKSDGTLVATSVIDGGTF